MQCSSSAALSLETVTASRARSCRAALATEQDQRSLRERLGKLQMWKEGVRKSQQCSLDNYQNAWLSSSSKCRRRWQSEESL